MRNTFARLKFTFQVTIKMLTPPLYSFERLEAFCLKKLRHTPSAHFARVFLAQLYVHNSRYDEARRELETLVRRGYREASTVRLLGEVRYRLGDYSQAITAFQEVENRYSDTKDFNWRMGFSHLSTGAYEKAVPYLMRAEELSSKGIRLYEALGFCCFELHEFESSARWYRKALSYDPKSGELRDNVARAHVHLGDSLLKRGKREEGLAQLRLALEIGPAGSIEQAIHRTMADL